jgi:hypothetical protein
MVYREQGYLSDSARDLIKTVKSFNWAASDKAAISRRPAAVELRGAGGR